MAQRIAGLKSSRVGWKNPLYSRPRVAKTYPSPSEEEQRRRQEQMDGFLTMIRDREARVAVEGDTDGNHDNFEPAE